MRNPQFEFLKKQPKAHGGELRKKREGRGARPFSTKSSMHLVLKSTKAKGQWSFLKHKATISMLIEKFAKKYGVKILSYANVGNHLHIHLQLSNRFTYAPFIRALTGAIALGVTGRTRWSAAKQKVKFWDYRPFTRVVESFKAFLNLRDYVRINKMEGEGVARADAAWFVKQQRDGWQPRSP